MDSSVLIPRSPRWFVLGGLGLACVIALALCFGSWRAERTALGEFGLPLDDSWIHCQIARNIAQGHGWSFNPGVPVQNSSGPLWTALVAIGFAVFGTTIWVPKILGVGCFLGCIVLAWRLARMWSHDDVAAVIAALLAATSVPLAWHGLSGMETPLAALLVAATFAAFHTWTTGRRRWVWPVVAAAAAMTRPEALVLVPLLIFERWRAARAAGSAARSAGRDAAIATGISVATLLPYFVLNAHLSGSIFPTTFAAKAGDTGIASAMRHGDLLELLLSLTLYPYAWSVHAVHFFGIVNVGLCLAAPFGAWAAARGPYRTLGPALLLAGLPALRGMAAPHILPNVHEGRYVGCLLPIFFICAAMGLTALIRSSGSVWRTTPRLRWLALAMAGLVVLAWVRLELRIPHVGENLPAMLGELLRGGAISSGFDYKVNAERHGLLLVLAIVAGLVGIGSLPSTVRRGVGWGLAVIAVILTIQRTPRLPRVYTGNVRDIHSMDVRLGRWVKQNVPPDVTVAVNDIGAIAYFGEHRIVDAIGLATPELTSYWSPRRIRALIALRRLQPGLCIVFPSWFPEWVSRQSLLEPMFELEIDDRSILGASEAVAYRCHWDLFERYYSDALLARLDPPDAYGSFVGHLRRGLGNLALPTRAKLYARAGDRLREQGDAERAKEFCRRAIAIDPQEMAGWTSLLQAHVVEEQRDDVGSIFEAMTQQMPNSPSAFGALGDWQARRGLDDAAARSYETALALHPDNVRLLSRLEQLWERRGDSQRAATYRARWQEIDWRPSVQLPKAAASPGPR